MRARIGVGVLVSAIAAAVIVLGPPVKRRLVAARSASAATPAAVHAAASPAKPAALPPAAAPAPAPARVAVAAPVAPTKVVLPSPAPAPPARPAAERTLAAATSAPSTPAESACAETLAQRRWQISIGECTALFEAHPNDAALALRIAHAHHAKGQIVEAGDWAKKAIALDPTLAEGFVLVARAEKLAGRPDGAVQAYRQYLTLAPRGWHSAEARAAVRTAPAEAPHARGEGKSDTSTSFATRQ